MGISVAEYYGQRVDVPQPISPVTSGATVLCPFMNQHCHKVKNKNKPICSVRKNDGNLFIVCENRLCATKKSIPLHNHQRDILYSVAKEIFQSSILKRNVLVKREFAMPVSGRSVYKADFVMVSDEDTSVYKGPSQVVLEMQGGGETSQTGNMTRHVSIWENDQNRTNAQLAQEIQGMGTIETNAWRRQQEQFIVKGNISVQTMRGSGMAFCVGSTIWDYLHRKVEEGGIKDLKGYNWTLALLGFSEDTSNPPTHGPIPLIVDPERTLYTNYHTFVRALTDQGPPCAGLFEGEFQVISGGVRTI
jgi:hypothetical protein